MEESRKKELKSAYKNRQVTGGVCCIRCSGNQREVLVATTDVKSLKNRFNFAVSTGTCPDPSLRSEWTAYGTGSFTFTVLEEISKDEDQSEKEFRDDVALLCGIWREKLGREGCRQGE